MFVGVYICVLRMTENKALAFFLLAGGKAQELLKAGVKILPMVYTTQNYWVSERCPLSGILNTIKHKTFRKLYLFPSSDEGGRYLLCWVA
jgi:hypothetical protein